MAAPTPRPERTKTDADTADAVDAFMATLEHPHKAAIEAVAKLDLLCAIKQGRATPQDASVPAKTLTLVDGSQLYQAHVARPKIVGGAKPKTIKRYRPVFNKFVDFATSEGLQFWNEVTRKVLETYAAFLDDEGYALATEYLELTTLKQAMKWFVESDLLPAQCLIRLPVNKPHGTTTYCWRACQARWSIDHPKR